MTIPPTLAPELSRAASLARSRRRGPSTSCPESVPGSPAPGARVRGTALCLLGLLATTVACGNIENSKDVADLGPGPTTIDRTAATTSPAQRTPTETANAASDADRADVSANERDDDDLTRSGSSTSRTRSGGGRTRVDIASDEDDIEADAGDVDAGEADAGLIEVDAGQAGDAGSAL